MFVFLGFMCLLNILVYFYINLFVLVSMINTYITINSVQFVRRILLLKYIQFECGQMYVSEETGVPRSNWSGAVRRYCPEYFQSLRRISVHIIIKHSETTQTDFQYLLNPLSDRHIFYETNRVGDPVIQNKKLTSVQKLP